VTVLIDSYSETNRNTAGIISAIHPSGSTWSAIGQALTITKDYILHSMKFYMQKLGSPTGGLKVRIYATSGTVGTSALPSGSALCESETFDSSTLTGSYVLYTINFVGINRILLKKDTSYAFSLEGYSATLSAGNYPQIGADSSSSTHSGNWFEYTTGAWAARATWDLCFYLYGFNIDRIFTDILGMFSRKYNMSADVTLQSLVLGSQNATTGWHALTYTTTSTIEMPIYPKGTNFSIFPMGVYTRYDYTGYTLSSVSLYDKVTDAASRTYRVLSITDWWQGDKFAYNVVELEKLTEFDD